MRSSEVAQGAGKLQRFIERNAVTLRAAASALGVEHPAILDWTSGRKRPRPHHRIAIATWTNGEVPAESWLLPHERSAMRAVVPFVPDAKKPTRGAA